MSVWTVAVALALIALSAFFVAIEFALVAARRYRLEEAAERSAAARAALRSSRDLSLLLAGSQLGITLCTLGLGALTKPAVDAALEPVFVGWGLPAATAGVLAFVLSLLVVTFLHLVVGEMAPKSWAIAHPERSAILLALPMRGFLWFTRPLLLVLNGVSLGGVIGLYQSKGILPLLVAFVAPHGVLELTAICIAGGGGFLIAAALLIPGRRTRRRALAENGRRAIMLIAGSTLLLLVAGTLEGLVSPIPYWPVEWKLSVSAITALLLYLYLRGGSTLRRGSEFSG